MDGETDRETAELLLALVASPARASSARGRTERTCLSPRLTALNRDDFVPDVGLESTVDLAAHYADADLDELDLGDDRPEAA